MANLRHQWRIVATVLVILIVGAAWTIWNFYQSNREYDFIRRVVHSEPYAGRLAEVRKSKTAECYPAPGQKPVCRVIEYRIAPSACQEVIKSLTSGQATSDTCTFVSTERTIEGATLMFIIDPNEGSDRLFVRHISTN